MNSKVGFLVVGAQKAGTTALDAYLRQHEELCFPSEKELHFFNNDTYFKGGRVDYSFYESRFICSSGSLLAGETTPAYMFWYPAFCRIYNYNPEMKLVFILRNPCERAYSHWNMERNRGVEHRSFLSALEHESSLVGISSTIQNLVCSYLSRGFYSEQINRALAYFSMDQMLFLRSDLLHSSPDLQLQKVWRFLGVCEKTVDPIRRENMHVGNYLNKMTVREKTYLLNHYESEIRQLERLLGWDCSAWLT